MEDHRWPARTCPTTSARTKVNANQERRAEAIASKLVKQGMGRDEAQKQAIRQAVDEVPSGGRSIGGASTRKPEAPDDSES